MCNTIKLFDILDLFCPFCKRNIGLVMNHWTISIDAMCFNTEYCLETTSFFDFFFVRVNHFCMYTEHRSTSLVRYQHFRFRNNPSSINGRDNIYIYLTHGSQKGSNVDIPKKKFVIRRIHHCVCMLYSINVSK